VEYYVPGDSVIFLMNLPNYKRPSLGKLRTVALVYPKKEYKINEIYDFYGTFISIAGNGSSNCIVSLKADSSEPKNQTVAP
jgi:hypothetical protein